MRITILTGAFFPLPPEPCGAVEMIWHGLAEEFARRGLQVTVVCREGERQGRDEVINGVRYIRRGKHVSRKFVWRNLINDFRYSWRTLRELPEADILVTNTFWTPILASWFKRSAGAVVVNVQRQPKGQMWLYNRVARLAAVSSATAEAVVAEADRLARRTCVVPNPILVSVFKPVDRGERERPTTIVFTGRVNPEKGLHLLVDAFRILHARDPRLRLRIIGPWEIERGGGGESYLKALRAQAEGLPVEFVGPIYERDRLARALQDADLYCYPSLAEKGETFGVAPLEAMATGLVPVVSDLACFGAFLRDGENGLVFDHRAPDPVKTLVDALWRLIEAPERTQRMSKAAASTALDFGFSTVADQYLREFRAILRENGSPAGGGVKAQGRFPRDRIRTMQQTSRYTSAWPANVRIKVMLWHIVWLFLFRLTPKQMNRWRLFLLRLFGAKASSSSYVASSVLIRMPWHLTLGENCAVNYGADLYTLGRIILHPRCTVSQEAYLCTGTHDLSDPIYPLQVGDIEIGEEAFVGVRALIMPGVVVGEGGVVGGGAVVTKDVAPWTIVAGNPARVIRTREFRGAKPSNPGAAPEREPGLEARVPSPPAAAR